MQEHPKTFLPFRKLVMFLLIHSEENESIPFRITNLSTIRSETFIVFISP